MTSAAAPSRLLPPMLTFHKPGYAAASAARPVTPDVPSARPAQEALPPPVDLKKLFQDAVADYMKSGSNRRALIQKTRHAIASRAIEVFEIHQADMGCNDVVNAIAEELGYQACRNTPSVGQNPAEQALYIAAKRATARNLLLDKAENIWKHVRDNDPEALTAITESYRANKILRQKMWKQYIAIKKLSPEQLNALKLLGQKQAASSAIDPKVQEVFDGTCKLYDTLCENTRQQDIKNGFCYSVGHYLAT